MGFWLEQKSGGFELNRNYGFSKTCFGGLGGSVYVSNKCPIGKKWGYDNIVLAGFFWGGGGG